MPFRRYDFAIPCPLPARQVFEALTDFSDVRVQYFPDLSRHSYSVIEQTADSAVVTEGSGPFQIRQHYEWTGPGEITSKVLESNVLAAGSHSKVSIKSTGSSSCVVSVHMEREYIGRWGRFLAISVRVNGGSRFFRRQVIRTLKNIRRVGRAKRAK